MAKWFAPPEATFVAKKMVAIPPQIIDPKMASAELERPHPNLPWMKKWPAYGKPASPCPTSPRCPWIRSWTSIPPPPSPIPPWVSVPVREAEGGGGAGGGGEGSGLNFFGIQTQAKSVIIVFDVSLSVLNKAQKAGVPITKIRDETMKLIDGLSINTKFNLVQYSRIYQPMAAEMQSPNDASKTAAKNWLEKEFRTDGSLPRSVRGSRAPEAGQDNGIAFVMDGVLAMQPDVVFLISDASFQSENHPTQVPWKELEDVIKKHEKAGNPTRINFIGFEMKADDKREMRSIVRRTEGVIKEIGQD
ncbi:MAG: hypothetical protein HC904_12255 [Blastochloris sp.]|nr:hypothetical protein [Blastochloris sp.]